MQARKPRKLGSGLWKVAGILEGSKVLADELGGLRSFQKVLSFGRVRNEGLAGSERSAMG